MKNTIPRQEFSARVQDFTIVVLGDSSIAIVESFIKSFITSRTKHTVIYSVNKDSKGSYGSDNNDN